MLRLAIEPDEPEALGREGWLPALLGLLGPRGARAAATAVAVLAMSLLAVSGMPRRLGAWVHERPTFSWSVDTISLDPPPPSWLPGGRDRLIAGVAEALASHDGGSALDVPLDSIERAFKHQRWVDRVESVRRSYPNRITVTLRYLDRPVAVVDVPGPGGTTHCVVGASSTILSTPASEAELADFGLLVRLLGIAPPAIAEPGSRWLLPGDDRPNGPNPVAAAASPLALALVEDVESNGPFRIPDGRELRIVGIQPLGRDHVLTLLRQEAAADPDAPAPESFTDAEIRQAQSGHLYILFAPPDGPPFWVYWGNPPGSEVPGMEVLALDKLSMLRDWLPDVGSGDLERPGALVFSREGPVWKDRL